MTSKKLLFGAILTLFLSYGCARPHNNASPVPPETQPPAQTTTESVDESLDHGYIDAMPVEDDLVSQEASALEDTLHPALDMVIRPEASGLLVASNEYATIDYSHTEDGYVMVLFTAATDKKIKAQVIGPGEAYTYNLEPDQWTTFPLSDGNGDYSVRIYENIVDKRYAKVLAVDFSVTLQDEFAPFIRPNQYVNYENASVTIRTAAELTLTETDLLAKVKCIYDYVVKNISYDYEKAASVQSGYLPDLDAVLAAKIGICFDYASLMTGMLRSQGIPCKLVVGYAGTVYHAWINVWSESTGWIDGAVFFDGSSWQRMDPTFAASMKNQNEAMEYIGNGENYTSKYIY